MTRPVVAVILCLLITACNRAPQDEAAVREGLREHLSKNAGLDLNAVDMNITDLKFEGNTAQARVAFKPKAAPSEGMQMSYTLERRGEKWIVQGRGSGHGGGAMGSAQPPAGELPSGHPPVPEGKKGDSSDLPPGHPPVSGEKGKTPPTK
jgi:hypothetical protein